MKFIKTILFLFLDFYTICFAATSINTSPKCNCVVINELQSKLRQINQTSLESDVHITNLKIIFQKPINSKYNVCRLIIGELDLH